MKKAFFKKSMALFLTVLMVMSCWVWVAPEHAHAATMGNYDVTIKFNLEDDDAVGGHIVVWYYPLKADKSGFDTSNTTSKFEVESSLAKWSGDNTSTDTIPGFPWRFEFKIDDTDLWDETYLRIDYIKIGDEVIVPSSIGDIENAIVYFDYNGTFTTFNESGKSIGTNDNRVDGITGEGFTWSLPKPDENSVIEYSDVKDMTCPKTGSTTQTVKVKVNDQYGVPMYNPKWSVKGSVSGTTGISVTSTTAASESTVITLTNAANDTSTTDTQIGTIVADWGTGSLSDTFTITDSYYTATFNYQTQNADNNTSSTKTETQNGYHGDSITAPTPPSYYDYDLLKTFSAWNPTYNSTITKDVIYTATYTEEFVGADYSAVDAAIAAANAEKAKWGADYDAKFTYASRMAVDAAVNAVVRGKGRTEQATVTGYANAINAAIAALEPNKYAVIFLNKDGAILLYEKDAEYKTTVEAPTYSDKYFDSTNHYTFSGWDTDEYLSVIDDLVIQPVFTAEAHTFTTSVVPSTCTQKGATKYTCSCGYSYIDGETTFGDHVWSEFKTDIYPTCTTAGQKSKYCTECNAQSEITVLPAVGHQWGTVSSLAPATCERDGINTRLCDACGICEHVIVPALEHSYVTTTVPATCTSKGYDEHVCQNGCGTSYRDNYTDVINHTYGEWETLSEARCGVPGVKKQTCACGHVNIGSIDALQHSVGDWVTVVAATCTGKGYQTKTCSLCNNVIEEQWPNALGHNYATKTVVAPTCTANGYTIEECSRENCGAQKITNETAALNHSWTSTRFEADCTHSAYIEHVCGNDASHNYTEYVNGSTVVVHTWVQTAKKDEDCENDGYIDYECSVCKETKREIISKTGHNYNAWVKTDATNNTEGSWYHKCQNANCGKEETLTIPAGGHNLVEDTEQYVAPKCNVRGQQVFKCTNHENCTITVTVVLDYTQHTVLQRTTDATCKTKGKVEAYCAVCDLVLSETEIPEQAHNLVAGKAVAPTCTESGYTPYTCDKNCGFSYNEYDATKPATGHTFTASEKAADCVNEGTMTYTCACGESYTETIPAKGHTYVKGTTVAADCTTAGTEVYTCFCGDSYTKFIEAAKGHTWSETWTTVREATDDAVGVEKRVCTVSGCGEEQYRTVAPIGNHVFVENTTKNPTCTEKGEKTFTCSAHENCAANYKEEIPATGHTQTIVYTAPECTVEGSTKVVCSVESCKAEIMSETIPAKGHAYNNVSVTVEAGCTSTGIREFACDCGESYTETIPAKGHDLVTVVTDAKCGEKGSVVTSCDCGYSITTELAQKGHIWGTTPIDTVDATCETDGSETYKCQFCEETNVIVIPKLGHSWGKWVITPSTNDAPGSISRKCSRGCTESVEIPAGGHNLVVDTENSTDSSCSVEGKTVYKCENHTDCGITLEVTAPLKQHTVKTEVKAASCTEKGYIKTYCNVCKETFSNETIDKLAHVYSAGTFVDATCTTSGYTPYTCSCGDTYNEYDETAPAKGHTLVEGASTADCDNAGKMTLTCDDCTYTTSVDVPALGHNYVEDLSAETSATCAAAATKTYKCSRCSDSYTISVGVKTTAHNWGGWVVKESATSTSIGYRVNTCTVCGQYDFETIPATGEHKYDIETENVPATCTSTGSVTYKCSAHTDCGLTSTVTLPKLEHDKVIEYTAAGCDSQGSTKIICNTCKATFGETTIIPKLGHLWNDGIVTPANCTNEGKIEYTCTRMDCNETKTTPIARDYSAHDYITTIEQPSCTETGSIVVKCSRQGCPSNPVNQVLPKNEHTWGIPVIVKATCETEGSETYTCTGCGATNVVTIPAAGHSYSAWVKTDATNDTDGSWDRECTVDGCDESETLKIPAGGHNLVEDIEQYVAPKCNAKGQKVFKCTNHENCSVTVTVELDYAPHTVENRVMTPATCTATGIIETRCSECNANFGYITTAILPHTFNSASEVAATCTSSGYIVHKCTCGYSYNEYDATKPATGHTFTASEKAADCVNEGTMTYTCACGESYTETIPAKGHTYDNEAVVQAQSCTDVEKTEYKCDCGDSYIVITKAAKGHTWSETWTTVREATDDAVGVEKRVCTVSGCGEEQYRTVAPIGNHVFVENTTKNPTCTEKGEKTFTCSAHENCAANYKEEIPATGHTQTIVYTAPECTVEGSTKVVCSVESCKAEIMSETIPAKGHAYNNVSVTVEAGCTSTGIREFACDCGESYTETIPAKGHDLSTSVEEATCTADGKVVTICSRCTYNRTVTLVSKGHIWGDTPVSSKAATCINEGEEIFKCQYCAETKQVVLPKIDHAFGSWYISKASTNTEDGEYKCDCTVAGCNESKILVIPAGGHSFGATPDSTVPATCTATGTATYKCTAHTNCGVIITVTLEKVQHELTENKKAATCTTEGYVTVKCKNCDTATFTTVIPATKHNYEGEVTTPATCTAEGEMTYTCTNDSNHTYTAVIEMKQHNYQPGTAVAPTCKDSGYTPYKCADCTSEYVIVTAPAKGHSYSPSASGATCTAGGTITYTCACGEDSFTTDVPALGHNYVLKSSSEANCEENGTETYECSRCGDTHTRIVAAKTTAHDWAAWITVEAPTNTSLGYKTKTCNVCGRVEVETIPATGEHIFDNLISEKVSTCTDAGERVYGCSFHADCGEKSIIVIPATGHKEALKYEAASCTADGSAVMYCENCPEILDSKTIPMLGHTWANEQIILSTCKQGGKIEFSCTCGATKVIDLPENENAHKYETVTVAATCKSEGSIITKCALCGDEEVNTTLPKLQHNWDKWNVQTPATNGTQGVMVRVCDAGCTETVNFPAGGHRFGDTPNSTKPASCTATGTATYKCTAHANCGVEITVILDMVQHDLVTETKDATCTDEGFVKVYCKSCKENFADVTTSRIAHVFEVINEVDPTCTSSGYKVYKCKTCNESYNEIAGNANTHAYKVVDGSSTATCTSGGKVTLKCDCGATMEADVVALGHDYKLVSTTTATCAAAATETYKCTRCDANYTISVGDKTDAHDFAAWVTVENATYTSLGYKTRECKICHKLEVETIPATGDHVLTETRRDEPTCEVDGTIYYVCSKHTDCGITDEVTIPATGHSEKLDYQAPTCTEAGYSKRICTVDGCGVVLESIAIPATGHAYNNCSITTQPGCLTEGTITCECACGEKTTTTLAAAGHDLTTTTKDATCEAEGSVVVKCSKCSYTETTVLAAKGHIWKDTSVSSVEATCTTDGSETYECKNCDKQNTVIVPKFGHSYVAGKAVAPTCTTSGYTPMSCDNNCGSTYNVYDSSQSATGHSFKKTSSVAATCTENGSVSYKCENCAETKTEITPKLGHEWGNWTITTQPKADTEGVKTRKCTRGCEETVTLPKLGHDMVKDSSKSTPATCTVPGEDVYVCKTHTDCGYTFAVAVAALGHSFDSGVETKAPTCETDGIKTYTCDCGEEKTESIPKKGHTLSTTLTPAKCEEMGKVETTCSQCGYGFTTAIDETGHTISVTTVAASCTADGYVLESCTKCSAYSKTTYIAKLAHDFSGTETVIVDATCTEDGSKTIQCKHCDEKTTVIIPHIGHTWNAWTETAYGEMTRTCSNGKCTENVSIPGGGHIMGKGVVTKAPTCKDTGIMTITCTAHTTCGVSIEITLDKIQHTVSLEKVEATCDDAGRVRAYCSECGIELAAITTGTTAHKWDNGTPVDPTCTTSGYTLYVCQYNEAHTYKEYDESKPALGHTDKVPHDGICDNCSQVICEHKNTKTEIDNEIANTCSKDGSYEKTVVCTDCYSVVSRETVIVKATGKHIFENYTSDHNAICGKDGTKTAVCIYGCGETDTVNDIGSAKQHKWSEWKVAQNASCTTYEILTSICSLCGETQITENYKKGFAPHSFIIVEGKAPTCLAPGATDYIRCLICNRVEGSEIIPQLRHKDVDGDNKCDMCDGAYYDNDNTKVCDCLCHKSGGFMQFIYKFMRFFWKIFKTNKSCDCGAVHY